MQALGKDRLYSHTPDKHHLGLVVVSSRPWYSNLGEDVVSSKWADATVTVFGLFALETNTHRQPFPIYTSRSLSVNRQFTNPHSVLLQAIPLKVSVHRQLQPWCHPSVVVVFHLASLTGRCVRPPGNLSGIPNVSTPLAGPVIYPSSPSLCGKKYRVADLGGGHAVHRNRYIPC